jgi:hypothetical protein
MSSSAAAPSPATASVEDPVLSAADASARELRALDALLAASDGDGPPVCSAVLRAWYEVASFEQALRCARVAPYRDFVVALERGDLPFLADGDLVPGDRAVGALVAAASVPAPPRADWPNRRELVGYRRALVAWTARLEREAATQSRSRSGHRRRVLPWVALAVVVAIGGAAVVHRRPVWRVVYFRTTLLAEPVASDLSANLGDNWGYGSPHRDVPSDGFSARWETCMVLDRPHAFEFVLGSDDGARLFVDDQMLVGQWKNQEYTEQSASVELGAGKHGMRVEHFDSGGPAELTLRARIDGKGPPRPLPRSFLRAPGHGAGPCD